MGTPSSLSSLRSAKAETRSVFQYRKLNTMILAVVQARLSSSRLPGKVLRPLLGEPMILRQIERVRRSQRIDELVVATSIDRSDDELADFLERHGVVVRRGSLHDVLSRFILVDKEFSPNTLVRLTGDNPLADPEVIDAVISAHMASDADYTSNSLTRTFPYGLDVECVCPDALRMLASWDTSPYEREHVTQGLYGRKGAFRTKNVTQESDVSSLRWSVDYPEDFIFVEKVYLELHADNPDFRQRDILDLIQRQPELRRTMADVKP